MEPHFAKPLKTRYAIHSCKEDINMTKILDMKFIRYANLFDKVTRIRTKHCFEYNNAIVFAVPRNLVVKAIGRDSKNLEELGRLIGKRIKIVAIPHGK